MRCRTKRRERSDRSDCGISSVSRREPPSGARPASSAQFCETMSLSTPVAAKMMFTIKASTMMPNVT
jgi:hypothetical protein